MKEKIKGQTDGRKSNVALAHHYHVGNSCSILVKFRSVVYDEITDGQMDKQTDRQTEKYYFSCTPLPLGEVM